MHPRNSQWWFRCKQNYSTYLDNVNTRIVEFGSYNINGTLRDDIFDKYSQYIGVDWRSQDKYVDVVSLAHEVKLNQKFDAVISASMLEHDPHWADSLVNMVSLMEDDGIMALSWGAALNTIHCLAEAPDGLFHPLRAGLVINKLREHGLYVHEFGYEGLIFPNDEVNPSMGEVVLVAFKDVQYAVGEQSIGELVPEDVA